MGTPAAPDGQPGQSAPEGQPGQPGLPSRQEVIAVSGPATVAELRAVLAGVYPPAAERTAEAATPELTVTAFTNGYQGEPAMSELAPYGFVIDVAGAGQRELARRITGELRERAWPYRWIDTEGPGGSDSPGGWDDLSGPALRY